METPINTTRFPRYMQNYKSADIAGLKETLFHTPLNVFLDANDINRSWERWKDLFLLVVVEY